MEESELEEGEACSYNITNDYSGSIDPDNDLSYIVRPSSHLIYELSYIFIFYLIDNWIMNCASVIVAVLSVVSLKLDCISLGWDIYLWGYRDVYAVYMVCVLML